MSVDGGDPRVPEEETLLAAEFGAENVSWNGREFSVLLEGIPCYVFLGAATRVGGAAVRKHLAGSISRHIED